MEVERDWNEREQSKQDQMKLGSKYNLLDIPCILKYKQIYWSKYLQSVEWSTYLHYQPLFTRCSLL